MCFFLIWKDVYGFLFEKIHLFIHNSKEESKVSKFHHKFEPQCFFQINNRLFLFILKCSLRFAWSGVGSMEMNYPHSILITLANNFQHEYPKCEVKNPCILKGSPWPIILRAPEKSSMFIIGFLLVMEFRAVVTECSLPLA